MVSESTTAVPWWNVQNVRNAMMARNGITVKQNVDEIWNQMENL